MKRDLTASRWASPEVRKEREYQLRSQSASPYKDLPQFPQGTSNGPSTVPQKASSNLSRPAIGTWNEPGSRPSQSLSSAQRQYQTRLTELHRFRRLFRRLRWKSNSLAHWSHRALSLTQQHAQEQQDTTYNHRSEIPNPLYHGPVASLGHYHFTIDPIDAERQFKIDFYEFYALLERGLVCLFGVWGIVITASQHDEDDAAISLTGATSRNIIGNSRAFHGAEHRFHANVLAALDNQTNPLYDILGTGDAREYIGVAKEFRNKWKDVEQKPDDSFGASGRAEEELDPNKVKRYEKVLKDLQLEPLLGTVLSGLEQAGRRAEAEIERLGQILGDGAAGRDGLGPAYEDGDSDFMDYAPFEVGGYERMDYDMEL
ncbi:hypothetical protein B0A52_01614 [Exophiala mesophila]|uniref:Uncharacterized protein n=1 Tax=Exophiala mesophila TaxID=212818 RepID=A0A438NFH9_EXOME|nr:hypothetical protein B0A52_01614 [Exophiala mesophila]